MAEDQRVSWETCNHDGCIGVRLPGGKCLAHSSRARRRWTLHGLRRGRALDVTRGVTITPALLDEILAAAPKDSQGHPCLREVDFTRATFQGRATFDKVTFHGRTAFGGATFRHDAWFIGVTFRDMAWFDGATFHDMAGFAGTTFHDRAGFDKATFHGRAAFEDATFQGWAGFAQATFQGEATFIGATFQGVAGFIGATFHNAAWFVRATFQGDTQFATVTFKGRTWFDQATFHDRGPFFGVTFHSLAGFAQATFEQARRLGPMLVRKHLVLDQAIFNQRVQIEASAATVSCRAARFPAGVQLRLGWAQVVLDDADLAAPSILTGATQPVRGEDRWARLLAVLSPPRSPRPRLLSVRRADVAGLTVSNVDLRACRFLGAHNLDKLRLEGEQLFAGPPGRWYLTRRQTLAEEHHWRHDRLDRRQPKRRAASNDPKVSPAPAEQDRRDRQPAARWYAAECQPPPWLAPPRFEAVEPPQPGQVAELYRALRKGREDSKDEPGAADFYYGEMEMRRHARRAAARDVWGSRRRPASDRLAWYKRSPSRGLAAGVEYAILSAYWLVSGYALRAWRALAAFAVLLVVFALLVTFLGGFALGPTPASPSPPRATQAPTTPTRAPPATTVTTATADTSFGGALVYGARTVIGLTRDPQPRLTRRGDVLQILLRILGPVLLGLAVLSVRGRVKR
jgi:uncharacterized protein YjbI with pentapeptide repeats